MGSAFAEVQRRQSTPSELHAHIARRDEALFIVSHRHLHWKEAQALASAAGDKGRHLIEGELPPRHIDAEVDLTDLQCEGDLEECGQESIEEREGGPNLVFPEKR
jgi:hypothetical protein